MNPYYTPPYMQQPQAQPIQQLPQQHMEQRVVSYFVDSAEQLSTLNPMPNIIYLGINNRDGKIFMRRMNNDGLVEMKTFSLQRRQRRFLVAKIFNSGTMGLCNEEKNVRTNGSIKKNS